jgi:hypothetical protein
MVQQNTALVGENMAAVRQQGQLWQRLYKEYGLDDEATTDTARRMVAEDTGEEDSSLMHKDWILSLTRHDGKQTDGRTSLTTHTDVSSLRIRITYTRRIDVQAFKTFRHDAELMQLKTYNPESISAYNCF